MGELRRSAGLIVAAAFVPLVLFFVLQSGFGAREERREVERRALTTTSSLILAIDGEVKRHFAALDALATARSLRRGDLDEFRSRADELIAMNAGWRGAELFDDTSGIVLARLGRTPARLEPTVHGAIRGSASFAGYGSGAGCPCLAFDRPAIAKSGQKWRVRLFVSADGLLALLPKPDGEYLVSAIADRDGRFIARTVNQAARFGQPGTRFLRGAVASGAAAGTYGGRTLEGVANYTGFARSRLTGWTAHVAFASTSIDNPARWFTASIGAAALLSLLLATGLILFALRHIAESRRIADRMQQAQKLEALGQLTGGLAHDFNNLMTPVIGALDFLSDNPTFDPKARRLLGGALSSARRAGKLTAQLLAFSRRQKLEIEPVRIAAMLDEMTDLFRQSLGDQHQLEVSQPDTSLCILADVNQLELAILNLIINARDASPAGSPIRLSIIGTGSADDGEVAIAVGDEGVGMDEDTRRRAIEPFFTTKPVGRGTGLGLAQVFGLAAQARGRLDIDSRPAAGTTVTLTLRRCSPAESRAPAARDDVTVAATPLHLLLVDDDPLVRAAIAEPLANAGHMIDAVSDGATGLAAIAGRHFDLVLVDFAMPGMNGAEMILRAREVRPDQPFLMITGFADSEEIAAAAPDTPILRKPFANADLIERVERLGRTAATPPAG